MYRAVVLASLLALAAACDTGPPPQETGTNWNTIAFPKHSVANNSDCPSILRLKGMC